MIDLALFRSGHIQDKPLVSALRAVGVNSLWGMLLLTALLSAGPATADEETEQRLTVTLITLDMAQTACGYRVDRARLDALLSSAHVTRDQLYSRPLTPAVEATLNGMLQHFQQDAAGACAEAWRQYSPSSELGLLAR